MNSAVPARSSRGCQRTRALLGSVIASMSVLSTVVRAQQNSFGSTVEERIGHFDTTSVHAPEIRRALRQLYSERHIVPLWTDRGRPTRQARAAVAVIASSETRG